MSVADREMLKRAWEVLGPEKAFAEQENGTLTPPSEIAGLSKAEWKEKARWYDYYGDDGSEELVWFVYDLARHLSGKA